MTTHSEFLGKSPVLETVRLIVSPPLRVPDPLLQQDPLLDEFRVILRVAILIVCHIVKVLVHVDVAVFLEVGPIDHVSRRLLCLFLVNGCQVLHLLQVLPQHFPLDRGDSSEEPCRVAGPDFSLSDLLPVGNYCACCHEASRVHCCLLDCCAHRDEGVALQSGALKDDIGTYEDIVANSGSSRYVNSVLKNGVAANSDGR